jgi:DNA-3-methyladenine glycosylase
MTGTRTDSNATPRSGAWRSLHRDPQSLPENFRGRLPPAFWGRRADVVAPDLLGRTLISSVGGVRTGGVIVETEAYLGADDPASHAATRGGETARNRSMFTEGGTAYVYFIYGMHWCFNVVTGRAGEPQAVLIRALEPLVGLDAMRMRRGGHPVLTTGPARLCSALGIDGAIDGHDLSRSPVRIGRGRPIPRDCIETSGRIGIRRARRRPLRFFILGNPHVSSGPHEPFIPGAE